jgi:hypothetical protein
MWGLRNRNFKLRHYPQSTWQAKVVAPLRLPEAPADPLRRALSFFKTLAAIVGLGLWVLVLKEHATLTEIVEG